jgi:hypothetical protein
MTDPRQRAITMLAEALEKPPAELKAEVDSVEREVAALRDQLIERLRAAPDEQVKSSLECVNAALSLIVGVEYPVGGIQREMLEQARSALVAVKTGI